MAGLPRMLTAAPAPGRRDGIARQDDARQPAPGCVELARRGQEQQGRQRGGERQPQAVEEEAADELGAQRIDEPQRIEQAFERLGGPILDCVKQNTKRVRELYPTSTVMRNKMENDRRIFLGAMSQIKQGMVLGVDKNTYVEPIVWTTEWAQKHYKYPVARSN